MFRSVREGVRIPGYTFVFRDVILNTKLDVSAGGKYHKEGFHRQLVMAYYRTGRKFRGFLISRFS